MARSILVGDAAVRFDRMVTVMNVPYVEPQGEAVRFNRFGLWRDIGLNALSRGDEGGVRRSSGVVTFYDRGSGAAQSDPGYDAPLLGVIDFRNGVSGSLGTVLAAVNGNPANPTDLAWGTQSADLAPTPRMLRGGMVTIRKRDGTVGLRMVIGPTHIERGAFADYPEVYATVSPEDRFARYTAYRAGIITATSPRSANELRNDWAVSDLSLIHI